MPARLFNAIMYRDGEKIGNALYPSEIRVAKSPNDIYYCQMNIPRRHYRMGHYAPENFMRVWRYPEQTYMGGHVVFDGLIVRREEYENADGEYVSVELAGFNQLLRWRDITYQATTGGAAGYTLKMDYADDMLKEIVYQNAGAGASSTWQYDSNVFSIAPDSSSAGSVTYEFPHQNALDTLQDIAELSASKGTALYFDIVMNNPSSLEFRTYVDQIGPDTTSKIMFADWKHNITNAHLIEDYKDEYNYVNAWGAGDPGNQDFKVSEDTALSGRSKWSRKSYTVNGGPSIDSDALQALADMELRYGRPLMMFECGLLDKLSARFGYDWDFGYKVKVAFNEQQYTGLVHSIDIHWRAGETERLTGGFRYTSALRRGTGAVIS